jgi:RNA polymerase sigma factor (sigma-70 family)
VCMDDCTAMRILAAASPESARKQAGDALVERYFKAMLACAAWQLRARKNKGLEAFDVVQEVFARLLVPRIAAQFDAARPLKPWLLELVRNQARNLIREERKQQKRAESGRLSPAAGRSPQEQFMVEDEVRVIIGQLTSDEAEICRLFYLDRLTAQQVAERLGRPVAWVYRNLHKVRTKVRASHAV